MRDGYDNVCRPCRSGHYRKWRRDHPVDAAVNSANYRARKKGAQVELTPDEKAKVKAIYNECQRLNRLNRLDGKEERYHVDHIIPLCQGGLHHPDNLQILDARENLRKGGRLIY